MSQEKGGPKIAKKNLNYRGDHRVRYSASLKNTAASADYLLHAMTNLVQYKV